MLTLYSASGAGNYSVNGSRIPAADTRQYLSNAIRLLEARTHTEAAQWLRAIKFEIVASDNIFGDDFHVLFSTVPLEQYEKLRQVMMSVQGKSMFRAIAEIVSEIGPYIRFVAVELQFESASVLTHNEQNRSLTRKEIHILVNCYIGVEQGYLGNFNYKSHHNFYVEHGLEIDPNEYPGTTRERFIRILSESLPDVQANILEGILNRFPIGSSDLRTQERAEEIRSWIMRIRGTIPVQPPRPQFTATFVERALLDAETLIQRQGATSGVDRIHTAFHGYLRVVCSAQSLAISDEATITELMSVIRKQHHAFIPVGPHADKIKNILRSMAAIVDALNPLRNSASMAHPNDGLLEPSEAMLVINAVRTLLHYIDNKLSCQSNIG